MSYIATFHTHLSAMLTSRALSGAGIENRLIPVPRALSSSCGTALEYDSAPCLELMDVDTERVYKANGDGYVLIFENE